MKRFGCFSIFKLILWKRLYIVSLICIVLKIGPNQPVRPFESSTGELSSSVHLNEPFHGQIGINCSNRRLNHRIRQTVQFFINWSDLNCYKYLFTIKRPIPRPLLLKPKLIISPYLVQTTRPNPMTRNAYKTYIWVMPPGPICWQVWLIRDVARYL